MNNISKIALISFSLLILIIGISCASAASVDHSTDSLHTKNQHAVKINHSTKNVKKLPAKKTVSTKKTTKKAAKKVTVKKSNAKKVTKKTTKKVTAKKTTTKKATAKKATVKKTNTKKAAVQPVNKVINGWNPKDHEVSRKSIGNGLSRVNYDDGYFRIIDQKGNILSYGY